MQESSQQDTEWRSKPESQSNKDMKTTQYKQY